MKKYILYVTILTLLMISNISALKAQYRTGIGIQVGNWTGATLKYNIPSTNGNSIEGSATWFHGITRFTGFYAWNMPIRTAGLQVSGLSWHYGLGAHVGFNQGLRSNVELKSDKTMIGIDAQVGLELVYGSLPFSVGLDVNPFFDINYTGLPLNAGLVVRYLIH